MSRVTLKDIRQVLKACKLDSRIEVYPRYAATVIGNPSTRGRSRNPSFGPGWRQRNPIDYVVADNGATDTEPWLKEYICKTVSDANDCVNRIVRGV